MSFTTSQTGINLIKSFEGCKLKAYQDSAGVWTIGYGHTSGVYSGMTITQNQFDALVSFTFNLGSGKLESSTLLKKLNQGNIADAANEFDRWVYADGKKLNGLIARRAAEKELFLNGTFTGGNGGGSVTSGDSTVSSFQTWLNSNYGSGSRAAVKTLVKGNTGNAVHLLQGMLYCRNFNPKGVDGTFGAGTESAVRSFQSSKGLGVDGKAGPATMYALYN